MSARRSARTVGAALALALAGCGVGPGESPDGPVAFTVTRDFGTSTLQHSTDAKVSGEDTVMRLTQRNATKVTTRFGGDFVQSIDGLAGGRRGGRPVDWFIYVDGVLTDQGAGGLRVRADDRIWWDHHDWGLTPDVRAVVGSFPAPFAGASVPVRVECAVPKSDPCAVVAGQLGAVDVDAVRGPLRRDGSALRVLVGPWSRLRDAGREAESLDEGPKASGVFARFDRAGTHLAVLDERGRAARTLGAGSGLVAAARELDRPPVWFVTGTDAAGVAAAADALDASALKNRFALALAGDEQVSVPMVEATVGR